MSQPTPASVLLPSGQVIGTGSFVRVDMDDWKQRKLPLLSHMEIDADLTAGKWTCVLYKTGCESCAARLLELDTLARKDATLRVACVNIFRRRGVPDFMPDNSPCHFGNLVGDLPWFIQTPITITLSDGRVIGIND